MAALTATTAAENRSRGAVSDVEWIQLSVSV